MPTEGTTICCCGSRTWVQIIAWLDIVGTVIGGIICFVVALAAYPVPSSKDNPNAMVIYVVIIISALLIMAMNLAIAILLLVGNKQERRKYLWTWLIKTAILNTVYLALVIIAAIYEYPQVSLQGVLSILVGSFLIYVVHRRIRDISGGYYTLVGTA